MEQVLAMISKWQPIGQGLFFLIILAGLLTLIHQCAFYVTVLLRGWPPKDCPVKIHWPWSD